MATRLRHAHLDKIDGDIVFRLRLENADYDYIYNPYTNVLTCDGVDIPSHSKFCNVEDFEGWCRVYDVELSEKRL